MSQYLIPQTPAGTRVQINSSGAIGTTTGNQRDRAAGGMTRTAHEVKLTTGELRWATFATILEEEPLVLADPAVATCATCGEDLGSQWATPTCA